MQNNNTQTSLILGQTETYYPETQHILAWHKVSDVVDGIELRLSNMAGGFPFEVAGRTWATSEQLYLAGEFADPAIQEEIASAKSGYAAKRFIKAKHKKAVREDFADFRLQWMLWVVWQKCQGNQAFRELLLKTGDAILVEDTTTDNGGTAEIWGCKNSAQREAQTAVREVYKALFGGHFKSKKEEEAHIDKLALQDTRHIGTWTGQNNIGKILMICRQCLQSGTEPEIDYDLLNAAKITIFGQVLTFLVEKTGQVKQLHNPTQCDDYDPDCITFSTQTRNCLNEAFHQHYLRGKHDQIREQFGLDLVMLDELTLQTETDPDGIVTKVQFDTWNRVISCDDRPTIYPPSRIAHLEAFIKSLGYPCLVADTPHTVAAFFKHLFKEFPEEAAYFFEVVKD